MKKEEFERVDMRIPGLHNLKTGSVNSTTTSYL